MAGEQDSTPPVQPQELEAKRAAAREWQRRHREKVRADPALRAASLKRHREEQARYRARQRATWLLPPDTPISTNKRVLSECLREMGMRIYQVLADMGWSGHIPTMRRKAAELAMRNAGYLVKTLERRAKRKWSGPGGPSGLFAWFLQRIDQVAQQSWAWGCGGRDLVALPVGVGEVRWGRPKSFGDGIGVAMARISGWLGRDEGKKPRWWRPPEWSRWLQFLRASEGKVPLSAGRRAVDRLQGVPVKRAGGIHEPVDPVPPAGWEATTTRSGGDEPSELPLALCLQALKLWRGGSDPDVIAIQLGVDVRSIPKAVTRALIEGRNHPDF